MSGSWTAPPGWRALRRAVFAAKGRLCWYCGRPATTVDHVGHKPPAARPI
jgi:5-methylcytosine-specific restriction endonuclease McrA